MPDQDPTFATELSEVFGRIDGLPWSRMLAVYGRAAEVPNALRTLASGDASGRAWAREWLARNLEHQDSLTQATLPATHCLLELLPLLSPESQWDALIVLGRILKAALFVLEVRHVAAPITDSTTRTTPQAVGALLPEFESDEVDEALLEEWDPSTDEWVGWHLRTRDAFLAQLGTLERIRASASEDTGAAAASILGQLEPIRVQSERPVHGGRVRGRDDA